MVSDTIRESELKNYEPEIPVQIVKFFRISPINFRFGLGPILVGFGGLFRRFSDRKFHLQES